MKKNFALACAAFVTAALMACSDDTNSNAVNTTLDSYLSSASDSGIYPPIDDPSLGDPTLNDPTLGDPTLNDPTLSDPTLPGPIDDPTQGNPAETPNIPSITDETDSLTVPESSADVAPTSSSDAVPASSETAPVSSAAVPASSSSVPVAESSSSEVSMLKIEGVYDYVKGNAPAPSRGCGKNSALQKTKSVENGDRFEMSVAGLNREYFITLPKNYDNTKPHKLLFAMHCMGSNAEDFVHHAPDQDHPSPYYGQQKLDTEGNYIFVAPRGDTDGMPWRGGDDKDHQFFEKLLTTMEDNYCIDTSRVFVTGFSFGSMFTNSLAQAFQHRVRAAVTYAVADWNIYIPTNKGKPIAWMDVHGTDDGLCDYKRLNSAITRILKNNGPNGTDVSDEVNVMKKHSGNNGEPHVCYDFQKVDPNHPVRVCTWKGGHQWTANDYGGWGNTWVPEDVHKFLEQF
ncbi:MAG: hypothetical protein MJY98_08215 [Fibrobacter sp.]|nr:hypothetical protein [Fibrobacter sp.]